MTKLEQLRQSMLSSVEDSINECRKKLEQITSDRDHCIGKLTALSAVKQTLQAGAKATKRSKNNGKA